MNKNALQNINSSYVVTCFHEFYEHVIDLRRHIEAGTWKDLAPSDVPHNADVVAEFMLSKIQTLLEKQDIDAAYGSASFAKGSYAEAQFVMAALADEIFLSMQWEGKVCWEGHLLEQRLFGTHSAGQVFFDRLDQLLQVKNPDRSDVALVYLYALGLGFRGKYRGQSKADEVISSYLKQLYIFVNRRRPTLFSQSDALFPQTSENALRASAYKDLPNARNWHFLFLGIALTYLLISYIIWYNATADISDVVDNILNRSFVLT